MSTTATTDRQRQRACGIERRARRALVGLDGRPLDAEQLVRPDGRPLQTGQPAIALPLDDAAPHFDRLDDPFDDDVLELDELQRRDRYGRYPRPRRLEVAHIIREFGAEYMEQARRDGMPKELLDRQQRVLRNLMGCRTSAMGEHDWSCEACGEQYVYFNSCGDRHCPKCREHKRREWAEKLERDLLPVEYHHLVLTLPRELTLLVMAHGEVLYNEVMRAAGMAILAVGEELLNAQLAVQALLHSWGQVLNQHVHIHCLVPAGGLSLRDKQEWIGFPEKGTFLSLDILADRFRDMFIESLEKVHASGDLQFTGRWRERGSHDAFKASLDPFRSIHWIVRHRAVWIPRGLERGMRYDSVVSYLARYASRVVIANSRLQGIVGDDVVFDYKDYRDGNRWKTKQMPGVEFIERFLRHMLPRGFHNKRRYGFWGFRVRTKNLEQIRRQMSVVPVVSEGDEEQEHEGEKPRHCAVCKAVLTHISGTHRPTVPVVLDMVWEDMAAALDVHPISYPVRTYEQIYLAGRWQRAEERFEALRAQFQFHEQQEQVQGQYQEQPGAAVQSRGPPPPVAPAPGDCAVMTRTATPCSSKKGQPSA